MRKKIKTLLIGAFSLVFSAPCNAQSLGYKIIQNACTLFGSEALSPNTYYEISGIVDLKGKTLSMPEGCFLDFRNGRFVNGSIKGNLQNEYLRPEWFGAKGDGKSDDTQAIQNALNSGKNIVLSGDYCISKALIVQEQGITLEKTARIKAIGNDMDYLIKYEKVKKYTEQIINFDGGGTLDCSGICGGIYYNIPKTYRLQNLIILNMAKNPALSVYDGYVESNNIECDGRGVKKENQPSCNVLLAGGSDHKFDRWTVITKTTGFKGCAGSSIFTRVHIWGNSECGFVVTGFCTFNMCYTDYCKIGFKIPANMYASLCILNHNTIGPANNTLIYSETPLVRGYLSFGAKQDKGISIVHFSPNISKGQVLLSLNNSNIALQKGSTSNRPQIEDKNKKVMTGYQYYDTTLQRPLWWNGNEWLSYPDFLYKRGNSSKRPKLPNEGDIFYDSSLKKMILFNGVKWVNLNGTQLDK